MRIGSTDACIRPLGKLMLAHADLHLLDSIVKNQGRRRSWLRPSRLGAISIGTGDGSPQRYYLEPKGRTPSAWALRNSGLRFSPADSLCNFRSLSADRGQ
jgi:hypothetical protein